MSKFSSAGKANRSKFESGAMLVPKRMVSAVQKIAAGWSYDVVPIG